jgi:hypothetical protein
VTSVIVMNDIMMKVDYYSITWMEVYMGCEQLVWINTFLFNQFKIHILMKLINISHLLKLCWTKGGGYVYTYSTNKDTLVGLRFEKSCTHTLTYINIQTLANIQKYYMATFLWCIVNKTSSLNHLVLNFSLKLFEQLQHRHLHD